MSTWASSLRAPTVARRFSSALALLVFAYLATRLIRLATFPPFFDEGYYAIQANTAWHDPNHAFLALADGKGPLQTWLTMGVLTLGFDPLTAVRLVSILAGLITLITLIAIARRIAGDRTALIVGAVYVVLPFALVHDSMGLVDPLMNACCAVALYLQLRLAAEPKFSLGALLGVALGLGLLTKANALFAVVMLPLSLLVFDWSGPRRKERLRTWSLGAGGAVVIAFAIESVERLSDLYDRVNAVTEQNGLYHPLGDGIRHAFKYARANSDFNNALLGYLTVPFILCALFALWRLARTHRSGLAIYLGAWAVGPIVIAYVLANRVFPRYLLLALPGVVLLVGIGAANLFDVLKARWRGVSPRLAGAVTVLVLGGFALARDAQVLAYPTTSGYAGFDATQYVTFWTSGTGLDSAADALKRAGKPGRNIVAVTTPPPYHLAVLFDDPKLISTGYGPGLSPVEAKAGNKTFRFAPLTDPLNKRATLSASDDSLLDTLPDNADRGQLLSAYRRPNRGTTFVVLSLGRH